MAKYDAVIVGSGHNGLVSACYLAKAGKKVLVLEKNDCLGGATASQKVFPEYEAYLSRYSYLVSLFPQKIKDDLGLDFSLLSRKIASYTPYFEGDNAKGLLISNTDKAVSKASILEMGFGESEWEGYCDFSNHCQNFARLVWPFVLEPLKSKAFYKSLFEQEGLLQTWEYIVEKPISEFIEDHVQSDLLRGVLMTDAKIGALTHSKDQSLLQNRVFIYHIIGQGTGEWKVPKGGMRSVVDSLVKKAQEQKVEFRLKSEVTSVQENPDEIELTLKSGEKITTEFLLCNATPNFLSLKLSPKISGEGTAFKVNLLLTKLPKLKDKKVNTADAFCGTFHIDQGYEDMDISFQKAQNGDIASKIGFEMYCHTLTDSSIMSSELVQKGFHTITIFGIDVPYSFFKKDNEAQKEKVMALILRGLNNYLEEPIENCIAQSKDGSLCIEYKSAYDLEKELSLPQGNIFHNDLSWFFATNEKEIETWGTETESRRIFICGSSAKRGGAVSGVPGHNAAMALLKK